MNRAKFIPFILVVALILSACGSSGSTLDSDVSSKTGWNFNDPDMGNYKVKSDYEQETGPGLIMIEGGTFVMGRTSDDVLYKWNNTPRRVTVETFYMDEMEVSNNEYRYYLHWLKTVYPELKDVYTNALPDTLVWRENRLSYNDPYVEDYLRHPSYNTYPVVGVSWLQANDYCEWRTDRVNELILVQNGFLPDTIIGKTDFSTSAYLAGKFEIPTQTKSDTESQEEAETYERVTMEDGFILPRYRLPTEAEWEYAARGISSPDGQEIITGNRIYPWDGHNVRYADPKVRGMMQANFKRAKGDMMGVAGSLNDGGSITLPVDSYAPNDFGLYNMAGNVNEWVRDVFRVLSPADVDDFRPYRGNKFVTAKDPKSKLTFNYIERLKGNGVDTSLFVVEDYRNFRDGDKLTNIDVNEETSTQSMYKPGTTNVSDIARVYKGGSWKDRAYWLQPGTRRFLDENKSTNDIGFRCAMNRVGSPKGYKL